MIPLNDLGNAPGGQDDYPAVEAARMGYRNSRHLRQVASKTVVSFSPDDPEYPINWSLVSEL
jgi:hypothetical protein